jgi:hypothetical protein
VSLASFFPSLFRLRQLFSHRILRIIISLTQNERKNTQATLAPLVRIQENVPQFKIPPLESGKEYHLQVYAVNAKGRSDPPYIIERVRVGSLLSPFGKFSLNCFRCFN